MTLDFDLGAHERKVTTTSRQAQAWFNQGLKWTYAFNQEEGVFCFREALREDPDCAMAHWGAAYAAGPFYNMPWVDFSDNEASECTEFCFQHIQRAVALKDQTTPVEQALIEALATRVQKPHRVSLVEFRQWDDEYAASMRGVYKAFPHDQDVAALFAEAMMTRTPWKLWNVQEGKPANNADTLEALQVVETAIKQAEDAAQAHHPAILHLHIHLLETSPNPERALASANGLAPLCPDAGHVQHMPGHIFVLCGQYAKACATSDPAIVADRKYFDLRGARNFYTSARCHDLHLKMYAAMLMGHYGKALEARDEMIENLSYDVVRWPDKPYLEMTLEGYHSMAAHVEIRFGKWQEMLERPAPPCPDLYCVSTSMHHYARAVSYAALKQFAEAENEKRAFYDSLKNIPDGRKFFNNPASDILAVGESMMLGEIAWQKGEHEDGFDHLRQAVHLCDALAYSEPWPWMHPPRHALGALLSAVGQYAEAEDVFRTDLGMNDQLHRCAQHPENIWALKGLQECLEHRGDSAELPEVRSRLDAARRLSDVQVTSACCCRQSV